MLQLRHIAAALLLFVVGGTSYAAEGAATTPEAPVVDREEGVRFGSLFSLEHAGSFRFRTDLFWNADLRTGGTSGMLPPLLENSANEGFHGGHDGDHLLMGANMRFRYEPVLRIGERVRVLTQIDVFDNLVLGSTAATGAGVAWDLWSGSVEGQGVPASDVTSVRDAITVKRAWGELTLLDAILIRAGRMPDDWGLGILRNGGDRDDDDFAQSVDRLDFRVSWEGFHFGFAWDFIAEGFTSESRAQPYGQPYGYANADDVRQWLLYVSQEPQRLDEIRQREVDLHVAHRPVFDWGVMSAFRIQDLTGERQQSSALLDDACLLGPDPGMDIAYDCIQLAKRDVFLWYPDVWARLLWSPVSGHMLRVEAELAIVYGDISSSEFLSRTDTSKDILQFGAVLDMEYAIGPTSFGLSFGVASGDDTDGLFGVLDGSEAVDVENPSEQSFQVQNRDLTNFKFARAFRVDQLLYREVIGTVTNSWFLRPWVEHVALIKGEHSLAVRMDLLYARALIKEGTPGNAFDLGLEVDITGIYRLGQRLEFRLILASLFPFGALDNSLLGRDADPAISLQGNVFIHF